MKKTLGICIAFIFVALFAASALAQGGSTPPAPKTDDSPLLTSWNVVFSAPGQDYPGTLKLEKSADAYKGSITTELGESPLTNIKVDGASFTANITVNAQGQMLDGTISGKAADGKISGNLNLAGVGDVPYSGSKK